MHELELPSYYRLPSAVASARGDELVLADGRVILDLYGGHCVNTLGAGSDAVLDAIEAQWRHVSFATNMFEHEARDRFLDAFGKNLPRGDWRVFLTNSGAEANENALKMSLAATKRDHVVAFEGSFHGRTAACEAVTDTRKRGFPRAPFDVSFVPLAGDVARVCELARRAITERTACVILEPIQSLAGVVEAPREVQRVLRERCDETGALLVFDEVQTGNGRLGRPWSSQVSGVVPDVFTTAKGAGGGLPIGITVSSAQVSARVDPGLFGSTFGGGPTVLAAAETVARALAEGSLLENVSAASAALRSAAGRGPVARVRGSGLLLGLELVPEVSRKSVREALLDAGVLVGGSNDSQVLRLTPALTFDPNNAERLAEALTTLEVRS